MSSSAQDKLNQVQGQMVNAAQHAKEAAQNVTSKVTDFFQGNPFETPVGKKIGKAFIRVVPTTLSIYIAF